MTIKTASPEFSRLFEVSKLPNTGAHEKLEADSTECAALAKRLQVPAVHQLKAHLVVKPWRGGGIQISGKLIADVEQFSVVSLDAFRQICQAEVERYFVKQAAIAADDDNDLVDPLEGNEIDLGELVVETLALELDPYPRKPGEVFGETEQNAEPAPKNPFSGLAALKSEKPLK
jgi:uncharacterized metal-binding protein YceD (DUF177 family)